MKKLRALIPLILGIASGLPGATLPVNALVVAVIAAGAVSACFAGGTQSGETQLHWLAQKQSTQAIWFIGSWGHSICHGEDGQFVTKTEGWRAAGLLEFYSSNGTLVQFVGDQQPFAASTEFPWGPGYTSAIGGQTCEQTYATLESDLTTVFPADSAHNVVQLGPQFTNNATGGTSEAEMQACAVAEITFTASVRPLSYIVLVYDTRRNDGVSLTNADAACAGAYAWAQTNGYTQVYILDDRACTTAADACCDGNLHLNRAANYKWGKCLADLYLSTIPGM